MSLSHQDTYRKTVLKYVFKKYGLSVNDHYRNVNIAENIPEIDVQIHLSPKDNLFFLRVIAH